MTGPFVYCNWNVYVVSIHIIINLHEKNWAIQDSHCNPCLQLAPILCSGQHGLNESKWMCFLAAWCICLPLEPISETYIFVYMSGITDHKNYGHHSWTRGHYHSQYIKEILLEVTEIWVQVDGQRDEQTDTPTWLLDSPLV